MKEEYDFSKGTRGKFYKSDANLRFPVYLEPEVQDFVQEIAEKKQADLTAVVNDILRSDMKLAETMK